jgi:hypothetical protein
MGDEGKTVTSTQNNDPWSEQKPFLTEGFGRALGQLNSSAPQYYPGQTVTDTTAQTQQGQDTAMAQAQGAANLNGYTTNGGFLSAGNPYFQGMVNQIGQAIRPGIDSAFASTGRLGSGGHANAFSSALADQAGKLAFQNYTTERGNQMAAAQDYSAPQAMMGVGQQVEAKQGEYLGDAAKRWDFEQNKDANKLAQYMNLIGNRSYGGQQTSTQPYTGNSTLQTVGTGLAGLGALGQGLPGLLSLFK